MQVRVVTGAVVRALLEHRHPGGLTGDDVGAVLRAATAPGTDPAVDPELLLLVLTGALGLLDVDDQPATLTPEAAVRHTVALLAVLLGPDPLAPWLGAALAERHRAETVEMP